MVELSTRNRLEGTVTHVSAGSVMAEVTIDVLAAGDHVTVLVKATEVMLGK